jgi:hypothetical protein
MLFTFRRTALTGFSTDTAELGMKLRTPRHEPSANIAGVSTVAAELDALRHHLHHIAAEAGCRAVFAVA